ncbi:hypothetical protein IW262DRAFT_1232521, partial [Armillaria fumosa]
LLLLCRSCFPSQTKDEVTDVVVKQLRAALGDRIYVQGIIDTEDSSIAEAIVKVGFWRRETQWVLLRDKFDLNVPKIDDELCSLSGVGPKMTFPALQIAWHV